ncbi:MAG: trypsin-like serine protease, partial [Halobacteriovoraceae bacterium]|nr:trypsin-like serine protease [Halobacteriovoraceae bacterium]
MKKMNLSKIVLLLIAVFLTGCEDPNNNCSQQFLSSYKTIQEEFSSLVSIDSDQQQLDQYLQRLETFLAEHKNVSCKSNGEKISPTKEIENFLVKHSKSFEVIYGVGGDKVIYGDDNRVDVMDSTNSSFRLLANSTAAQISSTKIASDGALPTDTIGVSMGLCSDQKFHKQINPARCSGFLVGPDLLVTAGHCVQNENDCANYQWAFGFYRGVTNLASDQVYKCRKIISQKLDSRSKADYALIQLDRVVKDRAPLKFRSIGKIAENAPLVVIGHPSGLPTKITDGANVRDNKNEVFFSANLDTFGGNSGSAVFNTQTGTVEGILVRGETDYISHTRPDGSTCRKVKVCSNSGCRGEDVTRITTVEGLIPNAPLEVAEVFEGIFESNFETVNLGGVLSFHSYQYKKYNLAGRKFLGQCALIVSSFPSPKDWTESVVADCQSGEEELAAV